MPTVADGAAVGVGYDLWGGDGDCGATVSGGVVGAGAADAKVGWVTVRGSRGSTLLKQGAFEPRPACGRRHEDAKGAQSLFMLMKLYGLLSLCSWRLCGENRVFAVESCCVFRWRYPDENGE